MTNMEQTTLENAIKYAIADPTLKTIGFGFGKSGVHHKLNEILKHIDLKVDVVKGKRVIIDGKRVTSNTYTLTSISAESILASL